MRGRGGRSLLSGSENNSPQVGRQSRGKLCRSLRIQVDKVGIVGEGKAAGAYWNQYQYTLHLRCSYHNVFPGVVDCRRDRKDESGAILLAELAHLQEPLSTDLRELAVPGHTGGDVKMR